MPLTVLPGGCTIPLGPGKDFETLAYIGPLDVRYNALLLGAVKAGYKVCRSW